MGLEGSQSDKLDVRGRLKRYAALRAALRAVSPAFPPETSGSLQERAQELSGRLRRAASPDEQPEAAKQTPLHVELERIDQAWVEFARELLSLVSDLPLSQLRATLPAVQESNPDEVLALLDLCVADERALGERWNLLDYLVTLASTETDDGRKRVALDPATLTPSLEALGTETGEHTDADLEDLVREFQAARDQISRGEPLAPIRTRLRDTKKSAVTRLPAPDVLRAVIACNVALWNRLEELTEVTGRWPPPSAEDSTPVRLHRHPRTQRHRARRSSTRRACASSRPRWASDCEARSRAGTRPGSWTASTPRSSPASRRPPSPTGRTSDRAASRGSRRRSA